MANINMLRGILVAGAVFAAVLAAIYGQWVAAFILGAGIAAHAALWVRLARERAVAQPAAAQPGAGSSAGTPGGTQPPTANPS